MKEFIVRIIYFTSQIVEHTTVFQWTVRSEPDLEFIVERARTLTYVLRIRIESVDGSHVYEMNPIDSYDKDGNVLGQKWTGSWHRVKGEANKYDHMTVYDTPLPTAAGLLHNVLHGRWRPGY